MINSNNIADLFNFIRNQKNSSDLSLKITKNNIDVTKNKNNADLIIDNKNLTINTKIDIILKQCCEIQYFDLWEHEIPEGHGFHEKS